MARILPFPWSLLAPRNSPGADVGTDDCDRCGAFNVEFVAFYTRNDEEHPRLAGPNREGSRLSVNAVINPQTELDRRAGVIWVLPWTMELGPDLNVRLSQADLKIPIMGGVRRASGREVASPADLHAVPLREAVDQLCGYFSESRSLAADQLKTSNAANPVQWVVKLSWEAIWRRWEAAANGSEPRTARVVEIARSHIAGIRDVCNRPRRMLVRHREQISVGKIQELDETCLRDLIRRPGRTIPEKAGSRQELLGVARKETVDTAENRVVRDFLRLCQFRAVAYRRQYPQPKPFHRKVQAVVDLQRNCEDWDKSSPISAANLLVGIPKSNYVLEQDQRYKVLWAQYQMLRREEEMVDKIWPWARILWADFARSLIVGFLSKQAAIDKGGWKLEGPLPAYMRSEHVSGAFVTALSISSRWSNATKHAVELWVVHGSHAHLCPALDYTLPRLGADLIVLCMDCKSGSPTPVGILTIHAVLSLDTKSEDRQMAAESLAATLDVLARQHSDVPKVRGLLLRGEYDERRQPESRQIKRLDCLAASVSGKYWFNDFPVDIEVLLAELLP
jgi:hypothetical protein